MRDATALAFHEVDEARWPDMVRLFEKRGGPHYCWCMLFRPGERSRKSPPKAERKAVMQHHVRAGIPIGLLAYDGAEPVAWCSVAPRETFVRLNGADEPGDTPGSVWSLTCFFIRASHRGLGITARLIEAAVETARAHGADTIEAYPVDPDSPTYGYMGRTPAFERAGFTEVGLAGKRRHVMRRQL